MKAPKTQEITWQNYHDIVNDHLQYRQTQIRHPTEVELLAHKLDEMSKEISTLRHDVIETRKLISAICICRPDAIEDAINYMAVKRSMDGATKKR